MPITRETAQLLATPPPSIDKNLWLYELCRFLIAQCNTLIVGFLFDTPPCSAQTCPEMRASEWQFLCSVHEQPKSCCAIDYCCHTLDWAANVVTNPKLFPSRFVAPSGGEGPWHDRNAAIKNLINVFRRLHRIFAHAWFQHRGVFWSAETQTGLYVFFKTVCDAYDTLPAENYKLPPEAEGLESAAAAAENMDRGGKKEASLMPAPILLQRSEDDNLLPPGRSNTRRHIRGSPSTGSAVTTVMEADEDESSDVTDRLGEMRISAPEMVDEDAEVADVPVIVEQGMMDEAREEPALQEEDPAPLAESGTHEKSAVTEQEINPEEASESEPAPSEEGPNKAEEPEATVEVQDGSQDEAPKEEDVKDIEKSDTDDTATGETDSKADSAPTSVRDFAEETKDETSSEAAEKPHEASTDGTLESDKPEEPENQDS